MKRQKVLWQLSLFVGCWKLWFERNNLVFNNKSMGVSDIVDFVVWTVSNWACRDKVFCDVSRYDIHMSWGVYF